MVLMLSLSALNLHNVLIRALNVKLNK